MEAGMTLLRFFVAVMFSLGIELMLGLLTHWKIFQSNPMKDYEKAKRNGWVTTGYVIDHKYFDRIHRTACRDDNRRIYLCTGTYEYTIRGKRYTVKRTYRDNAPDETEIVYFPNKPDSPIDRDKTTFKLGCLTPGLLIISLGVSYMLIERFWF